MAPLTNGHLSIGAKGYHDSFTNSLSIHHQLFLRDDNVHAGGGQGMEDVGHLRQPSLTQEFFFKYCERWREDERDDDRD